MPTTRRFTSALLAGLILGFVSGCSMLMSDGSEKAEQELRFALDYLDSLSAVRGNVEVSVQTQTMGMDQQMATKWSLRVQRPDRFAMITEGGPMGFTIVSDGHSITQYFPMLNRYSISTVEDDEAAAGSMNPMMLDGKGLGGMAKSFDADKTYEAIMREVKCSRYLGVEEIDGTPCCRCRFETYKVSVDVWIEDGDRPLVRKIVPDMSKIFEKAAEVNQMYKDMKFDVAILFSDWDTSPQFTEADFSFTPPPGAEEVDSLFGGIGRGADQAPHPLVGQPAPAFEAAGLDGSKIVLGDYLGKNVVILDFWATWCGPCVEALPIINEVAAAYADQGVVFYAVDLGEDANAVTDFLTENGLEVPVALDSDGQIGELYHVTAIPQTVIIGKDGKVQVVHLGFAPAMRQSFEKELDDLLAGKDLAAETLAEVERKRQEREEERASSETSGATITVVEKPDVGETTNDEPQTADVPAAD